MESSTTNKSPLNLNDNDKYSHCLEIYALLKLQKSKVRFLSIDTEIQTYAKLFNTYYTHCEYKPN
jgi:hypothetical protein